MVFSSSETRQWFIDSGRQAVSAVIESAGKVKYYSQKLSMCLNKVIALRYEISLLRYSCIVHVSNYFVIFFF